MADPTTIARGNIVHSWVLAVSLSPTSLSVNTTTELTFTISGLLLGDFVDVNKPTTSPGIGIANSRVSAANTLAIGFVNATATVVTPATEVYQICVTRPENLNSSSQSVLAAIV